ncbi:MAG: FKBP-type peptidyl-prolyl cis-trans isomerase [Gammaproteobacteria bacterium]|nr:FKBP-type peptidyl-prolyl cis-trans isomerase [Gammaproteobacteria bacterium]
MKTLISRLAVTSAIGLAATPAAAEIDLDNAEQKVSYSLGTLVAGQLANDFDNLDLAAFVEGFNAAYLGQKTLINQQEAVSIVQEFQRQAAASQFEGALNNSEAYLAENAQNEGVQVTKTGLQYQILTEGEGEKPAATDTVTVHYHGTTMDGRVFDSSVERGEPAQFPLNGVIAGWTEGVQLMSVGSKFKFFIHPDLAYGTQGAGQMIGPNDALIFEVELIKIGQ